MKQGEILFLLGSAVVVIFSWIAFTLIHNSLTSTISGALSQVITPIQPTFDNSVIDAMKKRAVILPIYTIQPQSATDIIVTSAPTPTPTLQPLASESAQVASEGGNLQ